ncbi:hypothetical protein Pse7367_1869 [Thalassoporum mexicanum PCC 7367]|uniref:hypothetical protein n=1 Tax=Thalassoporum mexicanum TaxID=3457544 RepID=UPI00029FD3A1|nr:hypothetical protein [Pseudanabaena sp. PCC 7367]AFY70145.1 hypothetical protein Pse7367_1869 [Pseudanabaena sp. PCC 7367]
MLTDYLNEETRASPSKKHSRNEQDKTIKRLSLSLSPELYQVLDSLAESQSLTKAEVLRKAIATEDYIQRQKKDGAQILIRRGDEISEIVFR